MAKVDYVAILEEAWQQHLAPRDPDAPTVISTFAGCGGSSLGYSMAGYRELLAVEWDDNAVATFKMNFPDVPVYHGDIHKLSVEGCMRLAGLSGPGELDVLDGSPPCQGFSTAGKREMGDSRNQLYQEYVRLLRGLQPKAFIMENVSGLVKGKMKLVFADIMRELKASGYQVSCRLLNAMYFQVPQSRQRLIWIGAREGREITYPTGNRVIISIRAAFSGMDAQVAPKYLVRGQVARIIHNMRPGETGDKASQRISREENKWFNLRRLDWNLPGATITKTQGGSILIHPKIDRVVTIAEMKRITGSPDVFRVVGKFYEAKAQIGNSVPPLFMRAIANHVRANVL